MDYYKYQLGFRSTNSILHRDAKLFQQYNVDQYAKMENQRLNIILCNQTKFRITALNGLMDLYQTNDVDLANVGTRTILPSSFIGSPRSMQKFYQDAMAIVREVVKPDLLITFTCNPAWREIKDNLLPGQSPIDRPVIVARVFKLNLDALLNKIKIKKFFGKVMGCVHVEFQKRYLPHAHILLILDEESKPNTIEKVNEIVSAEIPNPDQTKLFEVVARCMVHGPCDQRCIKQGKCSKKFPKPIQRETEITSDGYPLYRRISGRTIVRNGVTLDDRYIVPYNLNWLLNLMLISM